MTKMQELARLHRAMVEDERFGYSQWPVRWGEDGQTAELCGYDVRTGSYDCSSSTIYAASIVGLPVGLAGYTGDMRGQFMKYGWTCIPYSKSALQVGDVILHEGKHVAVYQGDGKMSEFRHNENGGIYSGIVGDQTGDEARVANLRDFGQQWILRYPENEPMQIENAVHRLYNPTNGWHHFTTDVDEVNSIIEVGWNYEGVAWVAPKTGAPVWRLYNPYSGAHMWTSNSAEHDELMSNGCIYEGVAFKSNGSVPVHRLYNPNTGDHHFTTDDAEKSNMVRAGWIDEGVAFWAVA